MAIIMPFAGYWVYRLIAGRSGFTSRRRAVAAGVGGYVGLNLAALATAFEIGIQPLIARDATGLAGYSPYPLKLAVPAMVGMHLLLGIVEALVTGLVVAYIQRIDVSMLFGYSANGDKK